MQPLRCFNCKRELMDSMEIEYSEWLTEYFCGVECAIQKYFEYLGSHPLDLSDAQLLKESRIKIIKGKLFRCEV